LSVENPAGTVLLKVQKRRVRGRRKAEGVRCGAPSRYGSLDRSQGG